MTRIREATADDVPAIRRLFNALIPTTTVTWRDHLAGLPEIERWLARQQDAGNLVLVATEDDVVVAYACWSAFRGGNRFPGYRHTVENTIHVDQDAHGRGIGRVLLTALIDRARERGLHVMVAAIDSDNAASIAFHRAMGFTEVARMPEVGRKFDRWLDLVLMQRILTHR
jgi:phosphinothricin acetyltransferase